VTAWTIPIRLTLTAAGVEVYEHLIFRVVARHPFVDAAEQTLRVAGCVVCDLKG